jgi:hypothetical protein
VDSTRRGPHGACGRGGTGASGHECGGAAGRRGVVDRLDEVDAGAVLNALRRMQVTDGSSRHGCLKWYWEEPRPVDTNAAFFTGLNLIVLRLGFPDQLERLDADARGTLEAILTDLSVWFDQTLASLALLSQQVHGRSGMPVAVARSTGQQAERQRVAGEMLASARYWREENWGWGEHMSNIYASVLLDQLSVLLMLAQDCPRRFGASTPRFVTTCWRSRTLMGGGPRAPMIRDYHFTAVRLMTITATACAASRPRRI